MAQSYIHSFHLPVIIARPFNHIGPGQTRGFVVTDFAAQIAAIEAGQQPPQLQVGNLSARRDFTDVRDIVTAYHLLLTQGRVGEVYNVGSGHAVSIDQLLQQLLSLSSARITVKVDPDHLRPVDAPTIVADPAKVAALGWTPTIPLAQTLGDVLAYWRDIIKVEIK
jgi:GDP-4-dehydro-6-deoxy-D-mannose reductase